MTDLDSLRYPIGKLVLPEAYTPTIVAQLIAEIKALPAELKKAVDGLSETQLDTPYRPGGWTIRQVVHHIADSHVNSYIRFKWTLTEEKPTIKAYNEAAWAELPEASTAPIDVSIVLLEAIHQRWGLVLDHLSPEDLQRSLIHPEMGKELDLYYMLSLYAWHGKHHVAHILNYELQITNYES